MPHDPKANRCASAECTTIHRMVNVTHPHLMNVYRTAHPRQWFVDRITEVGQILSKRPVGSAITWKKIPKYALECPTCSPTIVNDIIAFTKVLAAKVDEVVGQVECPSSNCVIFQGLTTKTFRLSYNIEVFPTSGV